MPPFASGPDGHVTVDDLRGGGGVVDLSRLNSIDYFRHHVLRLEEKFIILTDTDGRVARISIHYGRGYWTDEGQLWQTIISAGRRRQARVGHKAGRLLMPREVPVAALGYDQYPFGRRLV